MPAPPAASFKKPCKETAVEEFGHGFHSSRTTLKSQKDNVFFLILYFYFTRFRCDYLRLTAADCTLALSDFHAK